MVKKAIIYTRVSTSDQANSGYSLAHQKEACTQFAKQNGYEVVKIFEERGESAKTTNRKELQNLMTYCYQNKKNIDALIFWKFDRLSRDMEDSCILNRYFENLNMVQNYGDESFYSEEMTVKTRFGDYKVSAQLFNAQSYNEFLARMLEAITNNLARVGGHSSYPTMQVNQVALVQVIDNYIRTKLFGEPFNPSEGNNWRVLMIARAGILQHIMQEVSQTVYDMQNNVEIADAVVIKNYFSDIDKIKMRENFALDIQKSIYEKTAYPSNKGDFEKDFLQFADRDTEVERLLKINENYHTFAHLRYIRTDGLLSSYYPDFILKIGENIYLVETKAEKDVDNSNVKQKQKSALDWCKKINELPFDDRMDATWNYSLLDDNTFYSMSNRGATTQEILEYCKLTNGKVEGKLF